MLVISAKGDLTMFLIHLFVFWPSLSQTLASISVDLVRLIFAPEAAVETPENPKKN